MIRHGDTVINFTQVKGTQLADIQTVIRKRPRNKFSTGLSTEAQEALQQLEEEARIEQHARRGKRGSKGNVLFSDTVTIRRGSTTRTLGFLESLRESNNKDNKNNNTNTNSTLTPSSTSSQSTPSLLVTSPRSTVCRNQQNYNHITSRHPSVNVNTVTGRPGSISLAVDQVEIANRPPAQQTLTRDRKSSRVEDGKKDWRRT